ncbi:MAG: hypothetical protein JWN10_1989 [Solirubrobacterales bacterium]|nr:hypothetical protein [Solirubrobacterales bacterium]
MRRFGSFRVGVLTGLASVTTGAVAVEISGVSWGFPFASTSIARSWGALGGLTLLWLTARPLWRGVGSYFVARTVVLAYFTLLFLGVAAVEQLWLWKRAGWPIAATAPLPAEPLIRHAFWLGLVGGFMLGLGALAATRRRSSLKEVAHGEWAELLPGATMLAGIGLAGALVVIAKTHQLALLTQNVNATRFDQNIGVGYASLLEYELLAAVCVAGAAFLHGGRARGYALSLTALGLGALVAVRAERTPIIFAVIAIGFACVLDGRRFRRVSVAVVATVLVFGALALGAERLSSTGSQVTSQGALVHGIYDVSPEFREQSWVYYIYPSQAPRLGGHALAADLSSLVPSRVLGVFGIDKRTVYGDISHSYSQTMSILGYYPSGIAPLRVGIAGEMWADFGWVGLLVGLLALGCLAGVVSRIPAATPLGIVRKSVATTSLLFALITPIGALLPLVMMLALPLWLLSGATVARGVTRAQPMGGPSATSLAERG